MAVSNRAAKLVKLHKVAKKHYQPIQPPTDRSVLEHLMYACCLENSTFDAADQAFALLQESYFDWNEIRVTTAVELAEVMKGLKDPKDAATRLKKTLHSMFETHYQFDIDHLRKENLGKAVQIIAKYRGVSPFVVSYVSQNGLGGHSLGVDLALVKLMYAIGVIDEKESAKRAVPGIERAIPKNKGVEFFSLVHQLAVAYYGSPFNNDIRKIVLSIDSTAQDRFPKRTRKKKPEPKPVAKTAKTVAPEKKKPEKKAEKKREKTVGKKSAKKKTAKPSSKKKAVTKKSPIKTGRKPKPSKQPSTRKTAAASRKKKSPTRRLAKKKPR